MAVSLVTRDWADYPHVRIYMSVLDDPKFDTVRDDDAALAWYVRLLMAAHGSHPAPTYLPWMPKRPKAVLIDAGIIEVVGNRFTIKGLVKERAEVVDIGHRAGGQVRAATAERDEQGRMLPSTPGVVSEEVPDGREDIELFVARFRKPPTPAQRAVLDRALADHDVTGAKWAADIMRANPNDMIGAVIEASKAWRDEQGTRARAEERKPKPRGLRDPLQQEIAKAYAERSEVTA